MKYHNIALSIIFLLILSCAKDDDKVVDLTKELFNSEQLTGAANYSAEKGGASVLISVEGAIAYEDYHNGANSNTATHIHSATKLFWLSVAALAKQHGLIDYEENVSLTISEWQDSVLHPNKNQIRIADLLTLSSGLSQDFLILSNVRNTYQYVIDELDMVNSPGSAFSYGPSNYYVFGEVLQRKLTSAGVAQNPLEYLESEIFNKIGLEYEKWSHDQSGNPNIPNGCTITSRNWVKYGQLLLNKGQWNSQQIIDSSLIDEMTVPTGPNTGHGNFCWLNLTGGYGFNSNDSAPIGSVGGFIYHGGYAEIVAGLGAGKNRMYLIPSLNTVIIRQTLLEDDTFDDNEFLSILLQ